MMKTSYISCACNRLPNTADWGRNNLICYAANHAVVIYDPSVKKYGSVLSTLHAHSDRVNITRWIKPPFPNLETELLSASSDGTVIIWSAIDSKNGSFKPVHKFQINKPISICDAISFSTNQSDLLICTGTIDGNFELRQRTNDNSVALIQTLKFNEKLPVTARLAFLPSENKIPDENILLLLAMEDSTIHLYVSFYESSRSNNQEKIQGFARVKILSGHEDWVTSIDCLLADSKNLLIASGSQDNTIRLWKISRSEKDDHIETNELKLKGQHFTTGDQKYEVVLESILCGHDAWVYEVHWHPLIEIEGKQYQPMKLLSCSLDKTAIIWESDSNTNIWSETVRVGEVGGNSLGFYGCKFGPDGRSILAHSYHGSFHMWEFQEKSQIWEPRTAPTGHYNSVVDLCWDPKGRFLLTVSTDQTTRAHAPWLHEDGEESWHEIGRPQIHGYDMSCIAILKPNMFASGADEKVVRIFKSPITFKNFLQKITDDVSDFDSQNMAERASISALGLTNKAFQEAATLALSLLDDSQESSEDLNYNQPPSEDDLVRRTLWPELQKLYGHGYEIFSMAARYDGTLLATSSKSTNAEHAAIILWDTTTWSQKQKLFSHQLTVTQLSFSPNDKYLLSVSRDRRWSLFTLENEEYKLLAISPKKDTLHLRIIWCCAWTIDSKYFATGSRDGKVGIWSSSIDSNQQVTPVTSQLINDASITSLSFASLKTQDKFSYILAIGFENGCIDIRKVDQANDHGTYDWTQLAFLDTSSAHHSTVRRLAFRPNHKTCRKSVLQLASCGSDSVVKIHSILVD